MKRELLFCILAISTMVLAISCHSDNTKKVTLASIDSTVVSDVKKVAGSIDKTVTTPPITAVFIGSDGKTRRSYQITVLFYPSEERATLSDDKNTYQLNQYVTADGYGYKDGHIDLRGKGLEATLTYSDGLVLHLTEKK